MKRIYLFILFIFCSIPALCQNNAGKADDISRIVLTPIVSSASDIPSYATSVVHNKLNQIVSKHGIGGTALVPRFIITANLVEVQKDITPTAPPMIALTLSPTIYIGDAETGELYASCQLRDIKGVGENETKAYLDAAKRLNINTPEVLDCINTGKTKILEIGRAHV